MIKINKLLKKHHNDWNRVLKEAKIFEDHGALHDAIDVYDAFLNRNAPHTPVVESLANALLKTQQFSKGLPLFVRLIKSLGPQPHLLLHKGICEAGLKDQSMALASFQEALSLKPDYALAHNNLGKLIGDGGDPEKALRSFDAALVLHPAYVDAYLNRGVVLQNQERHQGAVSLLKRAVQLDPHNLKAFFHQTVSLEVLGEIGATTVFENLQKIIDRDPHFDDAVAAQALWFQRHSRFAEALFRYDQLIAMHPKRAMGHVQRATLLNDAQRYLEALASFNLAISLDKTHVVAYVNRALTLVGLGRDEDALASADEAICLNPQLSEAYSNRGMVLGRVQQFDEALEALGRAIELNPKMVEAYLNRSDILRRVGRLDEAQRDVRCAVLLDPFRAESFVSHALLAQEILDLDLSIACLDRALILNPVLPDAHFNKGLVQLLRGNLLEGFKGYEWRWKAPLRMFARDFQRPLWLGESELKGKSILVSSEQGLGDAIQMARYLPLLAAQCREVVVEVPSPLISLISTLKGTYRLVERGKAMPKTDLYCPIMSLPLAFGTDLASIIGDEPYLSAPENTVADWANRLGPKKKPRIGLAWSGNRQYSNDRTRSLMLESLMPLLVEDYEFHAVQKDIRESDAALILPKSPLIIHRDQLHSLGDTAGLLMEMDLVITVDTSLAHLAGALGRPTWILLSYLPDPRWLLDRDDSPWYSTARLFRQKDRGDWAAVLNRVQSELLDLFGR